jgi:hypothetical protein
VVVAGAGCASAVTAAGAAAVSPTNNRLNQPITPPGAAGCGVGSASAAGAAGAAWYVFTGAGVAGSSVATAGASTGGFLSRAVPGSVTAAAVGIR